MRIFTKIVAILFIFLLIVLAASATFYFVATAGATLDPTKLEQAESNIAVYDNFDQKFSEVSPENAKKSARIADIPASVKNAFIAAEDKNFYSHHGLDYKGMLRAAVKNLKAHSFKQGASTISQQLIKNTQLTSEKTIVRKLKEIKLTKKLEKKYTKDEILEMYLNTIYFGHACYGIAGASEFYFGKEVSSLTAAEGAMLAGVIRSPNNYSPFINAEKCKNARNAVLRRMLSLGFLNEAEYDAAKEDPLPDKKGNLISAENYLSAVYEEMENLPFYSPYKLRDGCKIYTYMEPSLQNYIENLTTDADRSGKSIVICNNQTHGISALYTTEGNIRRQPGSLLKPLAVYGPAIEENLISPCTPILDEKTNFGGYSPSNYKEIYSGYVSARTALAQSLNVPAVKILNELGIEKSEHYLNRAGLKLNESDKNLSLALGGTTDGYTLREMAAAYSVFANEGYYFYPKLIRKIESIDGDVLYERNADKIKVFSPDSTYLINDMLRSAAKEGTAKKLASLPFPVCAKTGTCGTEQGNTDAWTVSYTADHVVGVWMGNADNSLTDITGGGLPCHYALLISRYLYKDRQPDNFAPCDSITECRLDKLSYERDHQILLAPPTQPDIYTMNEIFRSTNVPQTVSQKFSFPTDTAQVEYKNNRIYITLCQTEYYNYIIKRERNGEISTIYEGPVETTFTDDDIAKNVKYAYTVIPYVIDNSGNKILGKEIVLPIVYTKNNKNDIPNNWWSK